MIVPRSLVPAAVLSFAYGACPSLSEWDRRSGYASNPVQLWETSVRCTATAVALRVAARQRGACFDA
eukprot:4863554-Pleurochrysis_carterae.AAC.7